MQTLIRCRVLRRLIWVCTVCQCPSSGFSDNPLYTALWRHSDKNSAAINNCYLDFVQTRGLISLVNDNHVDNNLTEILLYVYFGSTVNNRPNTSILKNISTKRKVNLMRIGILSGKRWWGGGCRGMQGEGRGREGGGCGASTSVKIVLLLLWKGIHS